MGDSLSHLDDLLACIYMLERIFFYELLSFYFETKAAEIQFLQFD